MHLFETLFVENPAIAENEILAFIQIELIYLSATIQQGHVIFCQTDFAHEISYATWIHHRKYPNSLQNLRIH